MTFTRREFMTSSSLGLAGATLWRAPIAGQAAQPPPPAVTKFEDVRRNVGIFTGRGGTIGWLAMPDGVLAIDSQYPDTAQACVDGLKTKSPKGLDMLINTHYHIDHTAGNPAFRPLVKTIVQRRSARSSTKTRRRRRARRRSRRTRT